jgi:hypothetical protein
MPSAFLPAQLLHVAAQFASTDDTKQTLTGILVRPAEGGGIRIDSTDGTRAFRVICPDTHWECSEPILLSAKAFKKRISYARWACIDDDTNGNARVMGGKGAVAEFMQAIPALWHQDGFVGNPAECYPSIDQLWPDTFGRACDESISFNARLLSEFLEQVTRYSWNSTVKMQRNSSVNPMIFTSMIDDEANWLADVEMQFLLMPVQVRA